MAGRIHIDIVKMVLPDILELSAEKEQGADRTADKFELDREFAPVHLAEELTAPCLHIAKEVLLGQPLLLFLSAQANLKLPLQRFLFPEALL